VLEFGAGSIFGLASLPACGVALLFVITQLPAEPFPDVRGTNALPAGEFLPADIQQVRVRVAQLDRAFGEIRQLACDFAQEHRELGARQAKQFGLRNHPHFFLHSFRPRPPRPS